MTIEDPRISSRMSESDNIPVLGRVYKCTVQRISCNLKQFSCYATFLLVSDRSRKIFIWIGRASSLEDTVLAENVAFDILRDDYQNLGEIVTIKEGIEHQQKLVAMLDQLFMTLEDYVELASLRLTIVENSPITLSTIERKRSEHHNDDYVLNPVSHSPISRSGSVAPLPFLLHVDRKTIAILTTGNQYDIWFAEAVSRREKAAVRAHIVEMAMYKVPLRQRGMQAVLFERSLCLVGQERATSLFRENFTSNTRHLITSNTKIRPASIKKKSLSSTNSKGSQQKCSDCVGDAILRLLGISPKPSPPPSSSTGASRMTSNQSSRVLSDDDMRSTTSAATSEMDTYCSSKVLSSAFSPMTASTSSSSSSYSDDAMSQGASQPDSRQIQSPQRGGNDSVYMKLQRLASRTEILFINEPRRNTKLLVLDLDHTLMDFSCRFDYMVEELKRPYLDDFLAQSYLYYDIAVWSQTNFKWLELKLTELGMLNRNDYKICFALDKSTMFTVRQQYVKPLEVIWVKCASLGWGPHNTVHVDDLERNFELNKQSGVLISPFHLKPFAVDQGTGDPSGESSLDGTAVLPGFAINDFEESATDSNSSSNPMLFNEHQHQNGFQTNSIEEKELKNGFLKDRNGSQEDQNGLQNGNNVVAQESNNGNGSLLGQNGSQGLNGGTDTHNGLQKIHNGLQDGNGNKILQEGQNGSHEGPDGTYSMPYMNGTEQGSTGTDDVFRNKSFDDIELQLLARYLAHIAVTVSDFSAVDHSLWRARALEMLNDS